MQLNPRQQSAAERVKDRLLSGEDDTESVACLCGHEYLELLADFDRHGIPSPTVICRNCGMVFVVRRPDEKALKRFYNEDYFDLYASKDAQDSGELYAIQKRQGAGVAAFLQKAGVAEPARVFDVGCGTGGMLATFAERGASVAGVDYANELVAFGNRQLGAGVLEVGGVEALLNKGGADLVIASHLVEHVADPVAWAESLRSAIVPGGHAYILTPGLRVGSVLFDGLDPLLLNMHLYYFTLGTLNMVMRRAGFSLVSGNQAIEALYRREPESEVDRSCREAGDPGLADWLRRTGKLRSAIRMLRPIWRFRNTWMNRTRP